MEKILIKSFEEFPSPEQVREMKAEFIESFGIEPKSCEFKGEEGNYTVELS